MRTFIIALLAAIAIAVPVWADQSITVDLDPPKYEPQPKQSTDLRLPHETLSHNPAGEYQYAPARSVGAKDLVIGRVGLISSTKAVIKNAPSSRGGTLYSCVKDTPIAIVGENRGWYAVLMIDSSKGWVQKSSVQLLNYQVTAPSPTQPQGVGAQIVNAALRYMGIPYRWGGLSANGIDCSGFVKSVFSSFGISLPRVARDQAQVGMQVGWQQLRPGDRLYFSCKGRRIDHTGIYMGNGLFIHSSVGRCGVAVDRITKPLFLRSLVAARRS